MTDSEDPSPQSEEYKVSLRNYLLVGVAGLFLLAVVVSFTVWFRIYSQLRGGG